MHREERSIQENERQEEVNLAERFVHHATEHLGIPKVNGSPNCHRRSREQNIVEVGHDEVGIVNKDINRCRSHKYARQSTDNKHRDERQSEKHWRCELNLAAPERA